MHADNTFESNILFQSRSKKIVLIVQQDRIDFRYNLSFPRFVFQLDCRFKTRLIFDVNIFINMNFVFCKHDIHATRYGPYNWDLGNTLRIRIKSWTCDVMCRVSAYHMPHMPHMAM